MAFLTSSFLHILCYLFSLQFSMFFSSNYLIFLISSIFISRSPTSIHFQLSMLFSCAYELSHILSLQIISCYVSFISCPTICFLFTFHVYFLLKLLVSPFSIYYLYLLLHASIFFFPLLIPYPSLLSTVLFLRFTHFSSFFLSATTISLHLFPHTK